MSYQSFLINLFSHDFLNFFISGLMLPCWSEFSRLQAQVLLICCLIFRVYIERIWRESLGGGAGGNAALTLLSPGQNFFMTSELFCDIEKKLYPSVTRCVNPICSFCNVQMIHS